MASTTVHVETRRTLTILADSKRDGEGTVDALTYQGVIREGCQAHGTRDRKAGLHITTITLNYPLDNATIQRIRSW